MSDVPPPPADELPLLTEVRRMLATPTPEKAVILGFETAFRDFLSAFGLRAPTHWTYSDIFRLGVRPDMGFGPVLLARLYSRYESVRYGNTRGVPEPNFLVDLKKLYEQPALRRDLAHEPGLPLGMRARGIPDHPLSFIEPGMVAPRRVAGR